MNADEIITELLMLVESAKEVWGEEVQQYGGGSKGARDGELETLYTVMAPSYKGRLVKVIMEAKS